MPGPVMAPIAATSLEAGEALKAGALAAAGAELPADGAVRPTKLFIGGISRRTTTKQLRDHFSKCGRVLDCVAMRQPDGRPRGFGYVTLDSPAAAQHYLSEPQLIDNRYVDLKPAVPDTSMAMDHQMTSRQRWGGVQETSRLQQQANTHIEERAAPYAAVPVPGGLCLPFVGGHGWPMDGVLDFENASPLSLLTRQAPQPTAALLSRPVPPTESLCEAVPAKVQLTSGAPPARHQPARETENEPPVGKGPLREVTNLPLREVTNIFDKGAMKRDRPFGLGVPEPLKPVPLAAPRNLPLAPPPMQAISRGPLRAREEAFFVLEDVDTPPAPRTRSPSPAPSAGSDESASSSVSASMATGPVPTVGSAKHFLGECRRCNFFAKGRCRNGYECSFCHFPHSRRKLSRQEKREAKLLRLQSRNQDGGSSGSEPSPEAAATSPAAEEQQPCQANMPPPPPGLAGVSLPPGLAPPGLPPPAPRTEATLAAPCWAATATTSPKDTSVVLPSRPPTTCSVATQTEEAYPRCVCCDRLDMA